MAKRQPAPDRATRGQTAPGRLRGFAPLLASLLPPSPTVVDVGLGTTAVTFIEWADALRAQGRFRLIGVERDPSFAAAAAAAVTSWRTEYEIAESSVTVHRGAFDLPPFARPADVIRVANVLRVYDLDAVAAAQRTLTSQLAPDGVLVEITCDRSGTIGTGLVLDADQRRRALAFHFSLAATAGFSPVRFRDWLPRDLRRHVRAGSEIQQFLSEWSDAWTAVRDGGDSPTEQFQKSVVEFASLRLDVDLRWLPQGLFVWRPKDGVPRLDAPLAEPHANSYN